MADHNSLIGHSKWTPYLLSTPSILMITLLLAFPVLYAVYGSLFDAEFIGGPTEFVGLGQYIGLFQDPDFLWSITRTAVFVVGTLVIGLALGLFFAFPLNRAAGKLRFLRGITIVPYLVSGVATAVVFRLDPEPRLRAGEPGPRVLRHPGTVVVLGPEPGHARLDHGAGVVGPAARDPAAARRAPDHRPLAQRRG